MTSSDSFLNETKEKIQEFGFFCPVCNAWLMKRNLETHLRRKHSEVLDKAKQIYYETLQELLNAQK